MPSVVSEVHYELLRDAIFDNNVDRFAELLELEGLDIDHFDAGGQTMLHLASFWGRLPLVKLLLNAGASLKTKNAAGCTALDLATHWGHSSVAELIRLRGGRSVWEEKLGQLQIRVEDLKLQNTQLSQQYRDKKREHEELLDEYHGLHTRHAEEKNAHFVTRHAFEEAQHERDALAAEKLNLLMQLAEMTERFREATIEKARSDAFRDQAHRELEAALTHRDEVLASMQQSVAKQQEITQYWQQAEAAAAIADSQRNFTLAEKEKLHKQYTATLGDLIVTTERLHVAEEELMTLRVELAEYIYGKEKDQRILRRAAQVLARTEGVSSSGETLRPQTTPAELPSPLKRALEKTISSEPLGPILNAKKKAQFSKAAQEFGNKVRQQELKKSIGRQRRHEYLENQYLTEGLSTPIVASDQFQEVFLCSLNEFATKRDEKWKLLDQDRQRQINYAKNTMTRTAISTAPTAMRRRNSTTRKEGSFDPSAIVFGSLAPLQRRPSHLKTELPPDEMGDRPESSHAEQKMRAAFFDDRRGVIHKIER